MNWIIIAMIVGLIVVVGIIAVASFTGYAAADQQVSGGCQSCNGKCTAESTCGQAGCSAAKTGICNCGK